MEIHVIRNFRAQLLAPEDRFFPKHFAIGVDMLQCKCFFGIIVSQVIASFLHLFAYENDNKTTLNGDDFYIGSSRGKSRYVTKYSKTVYKSISHTRGC